MITVVVDRSGQRNQLDPASVFRSIACLRKFQRPLTDRRSELLGFGKAVDQPPLLGTWCTHTFRQRTEDIGVVAAYLAFVSNSREAARPRQHAKERHFRQ